MKAPRKPTIRDVAAAAGVSLTTVSDALSGKGRLPEATRKKVHEVATQLDYRPSAIARGLRGQGLGLIGISIATAEPAHISDVWNWASIAIHASDATLSEGFAPILLPHNVPSLHKLRVPLDGVIVVDPIEDDGVLAFFRNKEIRTVTVGYDPNNQHAPWIDDDNERGIADLLGQTVVPGERIAFITLGARKSFVVDALRGMQRWASNAGCDVHEFHCAMLDDDSVDQILRTVLEKHSHVIVAQNDRVAVKVLARLQVLGIGVPAAVRVVSVTDAPALLNTEPTITALRQHPGLLGQLAVKVLFDLIRGVETKDCQFLPLEVVLRGSAPAVGHRAAAEPARLRSVASPSNTTKRS